MEQIFNTGFLQFFFDKGIAGIIVLVFLVLCFLFYKILRELLERIDAKDQKIYDLTAQNVEILDNQRQLIDKVQELTNIFISVIKK